MRAEEAKQIADSLTLEDVYKLKFTTVIDEHNEYLEHTSTLVESEDDNICLWVSVVTDERFFYETWELDDVTVYEIIITGFLGSKNDDEYIRILFQGSHLKDGILMHGHYE